MWKLDKIQALKADYGSRMVIGRDLLRGLEIKLKTVDDPQTNVSGNFKNYFSGTDALRGTKLTRNLNEIASQNSKKDAAYNYNSKMEKNLNNKSKTLLKNPRDCSKHIQGSKIAKGLPRVNLQYSKIKKAKKWTEWRDGAR